MDGCGDSTGRPRRGRLDRDLPHLAPLRAGVRAGADRVRVRLHLPLRFPRSARASTRFCAASRRDRRYPFGNGHPRFSAWVNSPPATIGVFAQALAAAMNPSVAGGNHAAVWVEREVIQWFKIDLRLPAREHGTAREWKLGRRDHGARRRASRGRVATRMGHAERGRPHRGCERQRRAHADLRDRRSTLVSSEGGRAARTRQRGDSHRAER